MKKFFLVVMLCMSFCSQVLAAEEPATTTTEKGSIFTSIPERKTVNSLSDVMSATDASKIQQLIAANLIDYNTNKDKMSVNAWVLEKVQNNIFSVSDARKIEIAQEIVDTIKSSKEQEKSLQEAVASGESKSSWLDKKLKTYVTKAIEITGSDVTNFKPKGRTEGFSIAGKSWSGSILTSKEAEVLRNDLLQGSDDGLKAALAVSLVIAASQSEVAIVNTVAPKQLTVIAINAMNEAKTVLRVKNGDISGKEGAAVLADTATASLVGLLSGFDFKQIGFIAGAAAGTAAGGALDGATGGISLGSITINGALIGAYLGEKIGSKIGNSLNDTFDIKVHAKIISEFEGFLGGTVLSVLNIEDVTSALEQIDEEEEIKNTSEEKGFFASVYESITNGMSSAWEWMKDIWSSSWNAVTGWV